MGDRDIRSSDPWLTQGEVGRSQSLHGVYEEDQVCGKLYVAPVCYNCYVRELSQGRFSNDNHKNVIENKNDVPMYEAKVTNESCFLVCMSLPAIPTTFDSVRKYL